MAAVVLVYLLWLRDVTETRFRSIQRYGIDFLSLVQFCYGTDSGTGNRVGLTIHVARHLIDTCPPVTSNVCRPAAAATAYTLLMSLKCRAAYARFIVFNGH